MKLRKTAAVIAVIVAALMAISIAPAYGETDESLPPFTAYSDTTYAELKDVAASLVGEEFDPGAPGVVNVYGSENSDTDSPIEVEGPAELSGELLGSFTDTPDTATFDDIEGRIDISRRMQVRLLAFKVNFEGRSIWVVCYSESGGPFTCTFISPLW